MTWSREELLTATGGIIVQAGSDSAWGVVMTDSRRIAAGAVFVALAGERLDGHNFLEEAALKGARCMIVHRESPASLPPHVTVIRVRDTLEALGDLAHYRREQVNPLVLAITGSNGKTTTKEMVAAILERASLAGEAWRNKVLKTEGNYNNLVGLPLTLLGLKGNEKAAVLELGTSRPGEIRRLTSIADPDAALITCIAPAHLEGLRSVAGVAREKGDLFRHMKPGGVAVVNRDDPWVERASRRFSGRKITYGRRGQVGGENLKALAGRTEFTLRIGRVRRRVHLRFCGAHNVLNAVGAAAMAHGLSIGMEAIKKGLETVRPLPLRMSVERWSGIGIINDAYNANPASMAAALATLAGMEGKRAVAVLGDMLELGRQSPKCHRDLGREAARRRIDRLYLLGAQALQVRAGALRGGMGEDQVRIAASHEELARFVREEARKGDWILFKGSRGMGIEKVLSLFKAPGE